MSLLRRIESARPRTDEPTTSANVPVPVRTTRRPTPGAPPGAPPGAGARPAPVLTPRAPTRGPSREVKVRLLNKVMVRLDPGLNFADRAAVRAKIESILGPIIEQEEELTLTRADRLLLYDEITDEIVGLGPLETLLRDDAVTEIMVNGPRQVYIERGGKLEKAPVTFVNDEHVMRIIDRIIAPIGRRIDETSPMVDARLADGSRVNAIIPPLSLIGPVITVRRFAVKPFTVDDLIRFGTATPEMWEFLRACVQGKLNVFVSGGTGSGKTTTLNVLSSFIPNDERIVTIEDAAELQLRQQHVLTLEARPPNIEGRGAITIRELLRNAMHMRPDRIIVGECRSGEALDMLQAMTTGHDGSLSTGHANSPKDMLHRLETMVLMTGYELPLRAIREQIAGAVDVIVHTARLKDGSRKVTQITEIVGIKGEDIVTDDVFVWEQTGVADGRIQGVLKPTGIIPRFAKKLEVTGVELPPGIFGPNARPADEMVGPRDPAGYSPSVKAGGMLYVSGMGPVDPATGHIVGITIDDHVRQCLQNLKGRLEAAGSSLDNIVWASWSLRDPADVDGLDEELARWFAEDAPARHGVVMPAPRTQTFPVTTSIIAALRQH